MLGLWHSGARNPRNIGTRFYVIYASTKWRLSKKYPTIKSNPSPFEKKQQTTPCFQDFDSKKNQIWNIYQTYINIFSQHLVLFLSTIAMLQVFLVTTSAWRPAIAIGVKRFKACRLGSRDHDGCLTKHLITSWSCCCNMKYIYIYIYIII